MHPFVVLALYSVAFVGGSLIGGWLPLVVKLTHRRMQIAISFVSGMILGIGMLHLLPHSLEALGSIDRAVVWLLGGFLFMFFLERFFHFHHHEVGEEAAAARDALLPPTFEDAPPDHDHEAGEPHAHHHHVVVRPPSTFAWTGAAIGLTLHSLVDGVAVAAAVQADDVAGAAAWAGAGTALAVALHKPFDALSIGTLMAAAGRSLGSRQLMTALYRAGDASRRILVLRFGQSVALRAAAWPGAGFRRRRVSVHRDQRLAPRIAVPSPRPPGAVDRPGGRHRPGLEHDLSRGGAHHHGAAESGTHAHEVGHAADE